MSNPNAPHDHDAPKPESQDGGDAAQEPQGAAEAIEPSEVTEAEPGDLEVALRQEIEAKDAEIADLKDKLLRALADAENTRRRAQRETDEARKYAITQFAREMLEISDNLERALANLPPEAEQDATLAKVVEGVAMTEKAFKAALEKQRIAKVAPEPGERFDHGLHQAMFEVETDEHEPGCIAQVLQHGYVLSDRLLRPALVGVAKKKQRQAS
ncbi:MAG: nucleotide exchange factor GrpE [Geminicoccaceae bacterium]